VSKQDAIDALTLKGAKKIPDHEWLDHPQLMRQVSGLDPFEEPTEAHLRCIRKLGIDWVSCLHTRAVRFDKGENVKQAEEHKKYTEWGISGSEWEEHTHFSKPEEVLKFDPFSADKHLSVALDPNWSEVNPFLTCEQQNLAGEDALVTNCFYTTLFQYFIMIFGWELFLITAASEPKKFEIVLDRFTEFSEERIRKFVGNIPDCPVFHCHDDIAMTRGLVFSPAWYRKYLFPRYEQLFQPARDLGKRIIFVSDGNYSEVVNDLFSLGVDGIIVDSSMDLPGLVKKHGKDKVLVGGIDTRMLTFGTPEEIEKRVSNLAGMVKDCPGFVFKAVGDLPHNIPLANIITYFEALKKFGTRC